MEKKLSITDIRTFCIDNDINYALYTMNDNKIKITTIAVECITGYSSVTKEPIIRYRLFKSNNGSTCSRITTVMRAKDYKIYFNLNSDNIEDMNTIGHPIRFKDLSDEIINIIGVDLLNYHSVIKYLADVKVRYVKITNFITNEVTLVVRANKYNTLAIRYKYASAIGGPFKLKDIGKVSINSMEFDDLKFHNMDDNYIKITVHDGNANRAAWQLLYI